MRWLIAQRRALTWRLVNYLLREYRALGSYHRPDAERFAQTIAPAVRGVQTALADAISAQVAEQVSRASGREVSPIPVQETVHDLRGVPTEEVYQRPFHEVWEELRKTRESDLQDAVEKGQRRLEVIADEDLQLTYGRAFRDVMQTAKPRALWWRRVPQGNVTCAMCLLVSTRVYRTGELNPIHPGCDCSVQPMFTSRPDGVVHDRKLLDSVYRKVGWSPDIDYRDLMVGVIEDHGELGTVLVRPRGRNRPAQPETGIDV